VVVNSDKKFPFSAVKIPQFLILDQSPRLENHAENGRMAIDTRFVFTGLKQRQNLPEKQDMIGKK